MTASLTPASLISASRRALRFACLLGLLLMLAVPATAQNRGDGTIYSRFGLGELETFTSSRAEAMGGAGYALRTLNYTNFANPASWSDQVLTRASAGIRYRGLDATDDSDQDRSRLSAGSLRSVQFSFPLYANTLGVGLSFRPYSRSNYRVLTAGQFDDPTQPDSLVGYEVNYEGRGGLQQVTGGLGWRVNDALSIGVHADVIFGIIEEARRTTFETPVFRTADRADATRLVGVSGTAGALLTLPGVLREDDALSLAATFTLPTTLTGERTRTIGQTLNRDTLAVEDGSVQLPYGASLGLAYQPDDRWTLVLDGLYEPWSNFESDFTLPGAGAAGSGALGDRLRVSGGFELVPAGASRNDSYLRRAGYRLGGYYERSYVRAATGPASTRPIDALAATGGLSLPTLLSGTRLDVNVEVGTRGTTSDSLVRDLFYGVSLNVNVGERWFQDRKLR